MAAETSSCRPSGQSARLRRTFSICDKHVYSWGKGDHACSWIWIVRIDVRWTKSDDDRQPFNYTPPLASKSMHLSAGRTGAPRNLMQDAGRRQEAPDGLAIALNEAQHSSQVGGGRLHLVPPAHHLRSHALHALQVHGQMCLMPLQLLQPACHIVPGHRPNGR